jgi:hypothetical protein
MALISELIASLEEAKEKYGDKDFAIVADETTLNDIPNIKFDDFYEIIELDFGIEEQ